MRTSTYIERRQQLTTYFDQTAAAAWRALTSNDPVSRIRETVRAGRDNMRDTLLGWLPEDMHGQTVLDAGCGTGSLAIALAQRGAGVVAIDIAPSLIDVARRRATREGVVDAIEFRVGDMLTESPKRVDHVVAMDSLIHYDADDVQAVIGDLSTRARHSVLFTSAPWTPALGLMHVVGRLIPHRHHRAPAIEPVRVQRLMLELSKTLGEQGWNVDRTRRVKSGFYISQAVGLTR